MRGAHRVAIRPDARGLAEQRDVGMHDRPAALSHQRSGMFEKQLGGNAAPARVRRREMHADIALGDDAEQRVGQRMQGHIGIAMTDQLLRDAGCVTPHRITASPAPKACTS